MRWPLVLILAVMTLVVLVDAALNFGNVATVIVLLATALIANAVLARDAARRAVGRDAHTPRH